MGQDDVVWTLHEALDRLSAPADVLVMEKWDSVAPARFLLAEAFAINAVTSVKVDPHPSSEIIRIRSIKGEDVLWDNGEKVTFGEVFLSAAARRSSALQVAVRTGKLKLRCWKRNRLLPHDLSSRICQKIEIIELVVYEPVHATVIGNGDNAFYILDAGTLDPTTLAGYPCYRPIAVLLGALGNAGAKVVKLAILPGPPIRKQVKGIASGDPASPPRKKATSAELKRILAVLQTEVPKHPERRFNEWFAYATAQCDGRLAVSTFRKCVWKGLSDEFSHLRRPGPLSGRAKSIAARESR